MFSVSNTVLIRTFARERCCGIFHFVWNISASAGSINKQDCIFHFLRFIAFVHSYITIVLNILLKITMFTSFIATTSKRLDYVCPATNRTWQRLTIISCDLTHERDTYFLNISHIIYLNYYLPRIIINRLQSKPLRLIKTTRVNSILFVIGCGYTPKIFFYLQGKINCSTITKNNTNKLLQQTPVKVFS